MSKSVFVSLSRLPAKQFPFSGREWLSFQGVLSWLFLLFLSNALIGQNPESLVELKRLSEASVSPDAKAKSFYTLTMTYWHRDIDSALFYSRKGLELTRAEITPANKGKLYFVHGFTHTMHGYSDSVVYYLNKAERIFLSEKMDLMLNRTSEQLGNFYREIGWFEEAEEKLRQAEDYYRSEKRLTDINNILINKGSLYYDQNRFNKALDVYQEAATYDSILNDTSAIALSKMGIGVVYMGLGRLFSFVDKKISEQYYNTSINYLNASKELFESIGHTTGICYCKMSQMSYYIAMEEYEKAESVFANSEECLTTADTRIVTTFLVNHAEILALSNKPDAAMKTLDQAASLEKRHLVIPHIAYMGKFLKAKILHQQGHIREAHLIADTVVKWFQDKKQYAFGYPITMERAKWYAQSGDYEKAYTWNQAALVMRDSLIVMATSENYDEVSMKFENKLLNAKVKLAEAEIEKAQTALGYRNMLIAFFVLLFIALAFFAFWYSKQARIRQELLEIKAVNLEKENELKKSQLEKAELERKLKEEEVDHFRIESEMREQELVFKSLQQANLLLLNKSIRERLGPYQFKMMKKRDQEAYIEELDSICRESARDPLSEFESMFTQLHSGFYEKLIAINPEFTRSELQMCALLRMNLPSKEIANLLNLSISRVDQIRHQIRKKLELDGNRSLTSFLILS